MFHLHFPIRHEYENCHEIIKIRIIFWEAIVWKLQLKTIVCFDSISQSIVISLYMYVFDRESEDTVLLVLKELYSPQGITPQMPGPDGTVKLYNAAASPPRGPAPPPMAQYSPPSNQPMGVPLMTPPSNGPPPMRTPNMMPPMGHMPSPHMTQGMTSGPPPPSSNVGPPPLAGFVKPLQK